MWLLRVGQGLGCLSVSPDTGMGLSGKAKRLGGPRSWDPTPVWPVCPACGTPCASAPQVSSGKKAVLSNLVGVIAQWATRVKGQASSGTKGKTTGLIFNLGPVTPVVPAEQLKAAVAMGSLSPGCLLTFASIGISTQFESVPSPRT